MKELLQYLKDNLIKFEQISDFIVSINDKTYQLIEEEDGKLFDDTLEMLCDDTEEDNYIFCFGGKWYWSPKGTEIKPQFNLVKYLGKADIQEPFIPWLGVRGKYEILNGSRDYKDWCKKANFLNCKTLGICEKNTLAGTLQFQEECKNNDIKSILGATYTVFRTKEDFKYDIKVYACNEKGWQTLLKINKAVLVDNNKFIDEEYLFEDVLNKNKSVFIVADPKELDYKKLGEYSKYIDYYQYDSVQFDNPDKDREYLKSLKSYIDSNIDPILIQDSFYLDKDESHIKTKLNQISGVRSHKSSNQYFKSFDEVFNEFDELFEKDEKRFDTLLNLAEKNLNYLCKECNFEIEIGKKHLPKYKMTEEEQKKYKTNYNMFDCLIEEELKNKIPYELHEKYLKRIEEEKEVIDYGDLRDYFLINREQVGFCNNSKILIGLGRGSAAGSLISYLLGLTRIDPFEYNLLFSRFLTKERAKNSISDIDIDHDQHKRDEVKQHLIEKYGYNQCCSVGTNGTLQLKAAIKDLAKLYNIDFDTINSLSKLINKDVNSWSDLFYLSTEKTTIKRFIKKYPNLINELSLILNGIKSESVHASAFIISPSNKTIFEWMPVRSVNKDGEIILVSEWSGEQLEKVGFLKQDILGLLQLTKFKHQIDSIKNELGIDIDIYNIPLNDKKVFESLSNGYTEDVFQFGSKGLAEYICEVKPTNINDLIVAVALYRPGAMESGFHKKWIKIKEGVEEPNFINGWEDITKDTNGLLVYQEQVMFICQKVGGFDLEETDKVRKCLHEDTLMWTKNGYYKIKDLAKTTPTVLLYSDKECKNKYNKVRNVFSSGVKDCVKLTLKSGKELICTPDHRVWTNQGWKDAITTKDNYILHEVEEKFGQQKFDIRKLYLIVSLITEGSLNGDSSATFVNKDIKKIQMFSKCIKNLYNKTPSISKLKNGCMVVSVQKDIINDLGIKRGKSDVLEMPEFLLRLNKRLSSFILGQLIDFDGFILNNDSSIGYSSKSKVLINQVQCLFEMFGVRAGIQVRFKEKYNANYYEVRVGDSRDILILSKALRLYSNKISNKDFSIVSNKKQNFSEYFVPYNIWYPVINDLIKNSGFKINELLNSNIISNIKKPSNLSLPRLKKILDICGRSKMLEFFLDKTVFWDKVQKIEEYGECNVYDFTMNWGCVPQAYINGLLVHNSLGKKKPEILEEYKQKFIEGGVKNKFSEQELKDQWDFIEKTSGYLFNLSHAACYAIMGYISSWFKVNYPLHFWNTSFSLLESKDKDTKMPAYMAETNKTGDIKLSPTDINKSGDGFTPDFKNNSIYWSLNSVKQCGDKAVEQLVNDKKEKGEYFDFKEFCKRNVYKGSKVTKQVIENLVLSGAFDEIENIKQSKDRLNLVEYYRNEYKVKVDKTKDIFNTDDTKYNWWWNWQQKKISGFALFDFKLLCDEYLDTNNKYYDYTLMQDTESQGDYIKTGGYVNEIIVRDGKKGEYADVILDNNFEFINIRFWSEEWSRVKELLNQKEKTLLLISGKVTFDKYKKKNVLITNENSEILILD